tara:strand:+ start:127 stop:1578 length:1452 start_codon:yes stop_codon:yes gene_type:complete
MLSSIRKFSKSILGKIVIALIAVAFVVGFGFSGSFSGKQNIVAEINGEKISSQEFVNYLQNLSITNEDIERSGGKSQLLERLLMNYISEAIISMEGEKKGVHLSERSLFKRLTDDEKFKKDGKFSQTKYEKFMISNGLTKPYYENLVKENEIKNQLLSFYTGGIKLPLFAINDLYQKENRIKKINYVSLSEIYGKEETTEDSIKKYYEKNKDLFKEKYKNIRYVKLSPEILIGKEIFDEEFFKKIDDIENSILDGNSFSEITSKYNKNIEVIGFINERKIKEDGITFKKLDDKSFNEIFKIENEKSPVFINHDNNYYIAEIVETKIKILNLEDKELKKMVKSQLKIINQIEKIGKLINDIKDKKFFDKDMIELAKKSNATIKTETIKNINDDSKFSLKLLREIYQFSKGQLFVMSDEKENYLVNIIEEKNPIIDTSSENYKEYIKKANAKYIGNIYQSYDTYINTNYKIEIKNTVLKRIENSF